MGFAGPEGQTTMAALASIFQWGGHLVEGGEVVDAAVARRGSDYGIGVSVSDNQAELIPLPFHCGPAGDDDAIKGVIRARLRAPADGGDHVVPGGSGADVARDGRPGARGSLSLPCTKAAFAEGEGRWRRLRRARACR